MHGEQSSAGNISTLISRVAVKVITITLLIFVCYAAINTGFRFGYTIFCAQSAEEAPGTDKDEEIAAGEGIDELAEQLAADGVILNKYAFMVQARLYDLELYPGTYKLNTSMSVREIVKSIAENAEDLKENAAAGNTLEDASVIGGGDEGTDTVGSAAGDSAADGTAEGMTDEAEASELSAAADGSEGSAQDTSSDYAEYGGTGSEGEEDAGNE